MTFAGTTQKCNACEKTVYLVDRLAADNRIYHKACFRCYHCKSTLKLSNFNSFEGVIYCRPHFDQLFKRTGSLDKSFEGTPKITKPEKSVDNENGTGNKVSSLFAGTREKCVCCTKTVYPIEKVTVNGAAYHKACFKCTHGGCTISPSNYIAHEGTLYCKHHHIQLFKEKGNYSQLEIDHEIEPALPPQIAMESYTHLCSSPRSLSLLLILCYANLSFVSIIFNFVHSYGVYFSYLYPLWLYVFLWIFVNCKI